MTSTEKKQRLRVFVNRVLKATSESKNGGINRKLNYEDFHDI